MLFLTKGSILMKKESKAMKIFRLLGFDNIAWSLRRLYCPVDKKALVLEVGAGGNPYPRANVLLDGYEESVERVEKKLVIDRPFVFGFAEKLPFKNKSFDFVIASHILEHSTDPNSLLSELMRVSKAGYIETPDAFFERINPFTYHRIEVAAINDSNMLRLFKKSSWRHDKFIVDEYERQLKDKNFIKYIQHHPWSFNMRFYWNDIINYEIVNPEIDNSWDLPGEAYSKSTENYSINKSLQFGLRNFIRNSLRWLFSQNYRNNNIDLFSLLKCPNCHNENLNKYDNELICDFCHSTYPIRSGIPVMFTNEN